MVITDHQSLYHLTTTIVGNINVIIMLITSVIKTMLINDHRSQHHHINQ